MTALPSKYIAQTRPTPTLDVPKVLQTTMPISPGHPHFFVVPFHPPSKYNRLPLRPSHLLLRPQTPKLALIKTLALKSDPPLPLLGHAL